MKHPYLNRFNKKQKYKEWMEDLFTLDGYLAVANAKTIIIDTESKGKFNDIRKCSDIPDLRDKAFYEKILKPIIESKDNLHWQNIPPSPDSAYCHCHKCTINGLIHSKCGECDDDGHIDLDSSHNTYRVACRTCEESLAKSDKYEDCIYCSGTKVAIADNLPERVLLNNLEFCSFEIHKLNTLRDCQFAPIKEKDNILAIRFNGGVGIILAPKSYQTF